MKAVAGSCALAVVIGAAGWRQGWERREPGDDSTVKAVGEALIFIDMTAAVSLHFVHVNGMTGELFIAEMMGAGGALFDYDNDGDLDLYLVQGGRLTDGGDAAPSPRPSDRLLRNDLSIGPDGGSVVRFTDVTDSSGIEATGYGMGVVAGDFGNDGWIDLYVTNFGSNQLWRNHGDGSFSDVTASSGSSAGSSARVCAGTKPAASVATACANSVWPSAGLPTTMVSRSAGNNPDAPSRKRAQALSWVMIAMAPE